MVFLILKNHFDGGLFRDKIFDFWPIVAEISENLRTRVEIKKSDLKSFKFILKF